MLTPTMTEILKAFAAQREAGLRTALPGVVTMYDPKTQSASVQPTLQAPAGTESTSAVVLPVIHKVPVQFPSAWVSATGYVLLQFPIFPTTADPKRPGTNGLLIFPDFSLETWLKSDGTQAVDPQDPVAHDLDSAVFLPGLTPEARPYPNIDNHDIRLVYNDTEHGVDAEIVLGGDTKKVWIRAANGIDLGVLGASYTLMLFEKFILSLDYAITQAMPQDGGVKALTALKTALENGAPTDPDTKAAKTTQVRAV